MAEFGDLLARLTTAVARAAPAAPLSSRLCEAYRELAGATGAAITVRYREPHRITLCATDEVSSRLEDLQDVIGEGPGHSAAETGQIETCLVPASGTSRWTMFVEAAQDVVDDVVIHAVPMQPSDHVFGVVTLYQSPQPAPELGLPQTELQLLANALGAALIRDTTVLDDADDAELGPWGSRARVHQATGMIVASLHISPNDALALLRAHAYAHQTSLSDIATDVVERRLNFPYT